jgi:hypothetical protein
MHLVDGGRSHRVRELRHDLHDQAIEQLFGLELA